MADTKVTRAWRIWGIEGHRQRESFIPSVKYEDVPHEGRGLVTIEIINSDITGTNDYAILRITADSAEICEMEMMGQVSDGAFETCRTGKIEEIPADAI